MWERMRMETRFSQRLSRLMKERKISGKSIGEAIGKSQKTISRYVNAEIDPPEEIKNAIFRAIAEISGIKEDGLTERELDERELFGEVAEWFSQNPECGEKRLSEELMNEIERNGRNLRKTFRKLSKDAKQYYVKHFDALHMVEEWEDEVLKFYHKLTSAKQEELIKYLERFDFNYETLANTEKLAAYAQMISVSREVPLSIIDNEIISEELSDKKESLIEEFESELFEIVIGNKPGNILYYPWYLSYTSHDWYLLLRIHIFELQEYETYMWAAEWTAENGPEMPVVIGRKLAFLLDSMK